MGDDEVEAIVIDNGSLFCKAGFAGYDEPRGVFPCLTGGPPSMPGFMLPMYAVEEQTTYVGYRAKRLLLYPKSLEEFRYPVQRGLITHWDDMEKIWHEAFYNELRVEGLPVLLTEPMMNPKASRERMVQIIFDQFKVPKVYIYVAAVLALYSSGRTTGCTIDSGHGKTDIVPIYEGSAIPHASISLNLGGLDVTKHLVNLLNQSQGQTFTKQEDLDAIEEAKETHCYVALDYEKELKDYDDSASFPLPLNKGDPQCVYEDEGKEPFRVQIGTERFACPEILFQPHLFKPNLLEGEVEKMDGLADTTFKAITKCDPDTQKDFYANIVLAGGNTMFPGISERMSKEVSALAPSSTEVKIVAEPHRKYSVWLGGSILASLSTFQSMWISKEEYDESGPSIVHRKCFS